MASRRPIVYVAGFLTELASEDAVAASVLPTVVPTPTLATVQPGEIAIDESTGGLVIRIGDLIWRFNTESVTSYAAKLDFTLPRNSHWIGVMA